MDTGVLNVGIDWREFAKGRHTGIQSYLGAFLSHALVERPRWTFHLYGDRDTVFPGAEDRSRIRTTTMGRWPGVWWDQAYLSWSCRHERLDVFLTPYVKVPALAPVVIAWINDLSPLFLPDAAGRLEKLYYRAMCRLTLAKARKVITISESTKRDILRVFGSSADRIETVYLGLRPSLVKLMERKRNSRPPSGVRGEYILHVSNLRSHKDVGTLLRAYRLLPEGVRKRFEVVVVGRKENLPEDVLQWMRGSGLGSRVRFLGEVEDADLAALYAHATVFVFPSRYEGFGLPVLEAMHAGIPALVSNVSSLPELVGDAGLLFNVGDEADLALKLESLLADAGLQARLGARCRRRAATFNSLAMTRRVLGCIEESMA
ncbi:MAG: glycosyltransferase family 4 protein [Nitrospirae bacterium]|nr:glycosyltransferase family 4 protein [Nitrospirota bacterium]